MRGCLSEAQGPGLLWDRAFGPRACEAASEKPGCLGFYGIGPSGLVHARLPQKSPGASAFMGPALRPSCMRGCLRKARGLGFYVTGPSALVYARLPQKRPGAWAFMGPGLWPLCMRGCLREAFGLGFHVSSLWRSRRAPRRQLVWLRGAGFRRLPGRRPSRRGSSGCGGR